MLKHLPMQHLNHHQRSKFIART